jgi:hypothetical protein
MASIELLDEETLNVTLNDDIGLESNINEPESINVEQLPNDYTPSYTETDPIFVSSPAASIKEDDITNWNSKSDFDGDYESLTNKPTIPTIPTNLSSFTDDLGSSPTHTHSQYLTEHQDISGKVDKETGKGLSSNDFTDTYKSNVDSNTVARHSHSNKSVLDDISSSDVSSWDSKQEALVSGTNIKTINNQSLLGSGNITIQGGGGGTATDVQINGTSITSNDVANIVTEGTYNASTNKIATKSDIPTKTSDLINDSGYSKIYYVSTHNNYTYEQIKNLIDDGYEICLKINGLNGQVVFFNNAIANMTRFNSSWIQFSFAWTTESYVYIYYFSNNTWETGFYDLLEYEPGKDLSTNDFTDEYKSNVDSNTSARHTHSNKSVLDDISSSDITNWNNKSTFSGNYNDLTNKPTIPDELSDLSDDSTHRLVTDTEKTTWNNKSDFSGSYTDLSNKQSIPSKTSDLTNDLGYITSSHTQDMLVFTSVETKTDANLGTIEIVTDPERDGSVNPAFIDSSAIRYKEDDDLEDIIDGKQDALVSGTNIKTINSTSLLGSGDITVSTFSGSYNDLSNKPTIPTKTSDLTNDSGFITDFGNAKTYYGTCSTASTTIDKVIVCPTFVLEEGVHITVSFKYGEGTSSFTTLNVNNTGAIRVYRLKSSIVTGYSGSLWQSGEMVDFTYNGEGWVIHERGLASTSQYGLVMLSNSVTSTSSSDGATSKAVKTAYDLADSKQDAITSTNKLDYSLIDNTPTIPTKVSDLTNDSGFIDSSYHDSSKQDELVSGTNIKTINGNSILGSGNLTINASAEVSNLLVALGLDTETYSTSTTYAVGDTVVHNNTVYECNTANTTGTWDSTKWDLVPIIVND